MGSDFIYKYTDHHVVDIVSDLQLKVTPPNEFNDPFEFLPHIMAAMTLRKAKKVLKTKSEQRKMHQNWKTQGYLGSFNEFKDLLKSDKFQKLLVDEFPSKLAAYRHKYQDYVSDDHGILCMCKNPASILMWSHYTDSHRGAVIAFDANHSFFEHGVVQEVEYKDDRIV